MLNLSAGRTLYLQTVFPYTVLISSYLKLNEETDLL